MDLSSLVRADPGPLTSPAPRADRALRRPASLLATAFLLAFGVDALVSLADELVWAAFGTRTLSGVREVAAGVPVLLAPWLAVALPLCPGLRAGAFVPALAFLLWVALGALPLPVWMTTREAGLCLSVLQTALAALAFLLVRRRSGAGSWLVRDADLAAAPLRPRRALAFVLATVLLLPPLLVAYGLFSFSVALEQATGGFMRFDLAGMSGDDREYRNGEASVRLVGMMHVGDGASYRDLFASFGAGSVVLAEGVTDAEDRLAGGLSYEPLAARLGLEMQPPVEEVLAEQLVSAPEQDLPRVVHADLDAAEFSDETIAFLRGMAGVFESPDLETALARASELGAEGDAEWGAAVWRDIVERRNTHLLGVLDEALGEHRLVVIPWGALHLPGIERGLLARGFERVSARTRPIFEWAAVANALWRRAAPEARGGVPAGR